MDPMNWYVGECGEGTHYARMLNAEGGAIVTVMGLTRTEAALYPARWVAESLRISQEREAAAAVAREVELLKALSEAKPMGRPS